MSDISGTDFLEEIGKHQDLPEQIVGDGKIHRYGPKKALWYVLFPDGIPAGAFGDWRKPDQQHKWCAKGSSEMTNAEHAAHRERMERICSERDEKQRKLYKKVQEEAERILESAKPADPEHGYLQRKGIKPHNLRQTQRDGLEVLLVEARDADGTLWSLQRIYPDGREVDKCFLKGGRKQGCFHTFGESSGIRVLCEGIATAASLHEATGHCVHSAFDCGNLKPVAEALHAKYPDAEILIAADDDHRTKGNPGRSKAEEVARAVNGRVALPDFGPDRPDDATDFNDLAADQGLEAVRKCIEDALHSQQSSDKGTDQKEDWPEPIPLIREDDAPQPYPVDSLGTIAAEAVNELHGYGQQPLAMIGSSALAAASLACQGLADVARDSVNVGPISLSVLCVAESGERKTSTDQVFSQPLRDWQRSQADEMQDDIRKSIARHAAWESERTGLLTAIREGKKNPQSAKGKELDTFKSELESHELEEPEILCAPQLFLEDATPEALAWFAATEHPSFAIWSDEAGLTVGSQGMENKTIMRFLSLMNRLWGGGEFMPTRKTTNTALVSGRRMTVNLMLQPAVLEHWQMAKNGVSRGIGVFARFLVLKPESTMGTRNYQDPPESSPKMEAFHNRIRELMGMALPLDEKKRLTPQPLHLSPEAKQHWTHYHDKVESGLVPGGEFKDRRDFVSRSAEQAARIAGVLHVFESGPGGTISEDTMRRAVRLAAWHLHEAGRMFTTSGLPQAFRDAVQLLEWLSGQFQVSQESQQSQRSILQHGPNPVRDKDRRDAALRVLEDHGWVRLRSEGRQRLVDLHPRLRA